MTRLAGHIGLGLAGDAESHQHLAVERAFAHRVVALIGQIDRIVRTHMDAVRPAEYAFTPGAQKIALGIEYCDRVLAAIERIDPILPVDADRRAITKSDFLRHFRPVLVDLEGVLTAPQLHRHASLPSTVLFAGEHHRQENANLASAARSSFPMALIVSQAYDATDLFAGSTRSPSCQKS